mgnify:CR=1 FL=1
MKTEVTVTGKTYDEALTKALLELGTTSERLEVSVLEQGSAGLLGFIGSKPWKLRAVLKTEPIRQENQTDELALEVPVAEEPVKTSDSGGRKRCGSTGRSQGSRRNGGHSRKRNGRDSPGSAEGEQKGWQ